jgi:hypothetical protein
MFGIWCEVWGGVTGNRAAWMKADGEIVRYETRDEAETEASVQNERTNRHRRERSANFRYTVRELDGE